MRCFTFFQRQTFKMMSLEKSSQACVAVARTLVDLESINEVIHCQDLVETVESFTNEGPAHYFIESDEVRLENFQCLHDKAFLIFSSLSQGLEWNLGLTISSGF